MLTLHGNSNIVSNVLKLKGIPFDKGEPDSVLTLQTKQFEIQGLHSIIQYLDERFPVPQLISGDIDNKARVRMIARTLLKYHAPCDRLAEEASPFVLGKHITLIDLIVADQTKHQPFTTFINGVINAS